MSKIDELDDRIRELANLRRQHDEALEREDEAENVYINSVEYQTYMARNKERLAVSALVDKAEASVRLLAVSLYKETNEKRFPGVVVKVHKNFTYSKDAALDYCIKHLPKALSLISKKFEAVAEVSELDFVTIEDDPRAAIDSDLSGFLGGE